MNIYRLVTNNSIEEDIVERAKKKMGVGPPCDTEDGHHWERVMVGRTTLVIGWITGVLGLCVQAGWLFGIKLCHH